MARRIKLRVLKRTSKTADGATALVRIHCARKLSHTLSSSRSRGNKADGTRLREVWAPLWGHSEGLG